MRLVYLAALAAFSSHILGWNSVGHMVVARIAERKLQSEATTVLNKVYSTLDSLKEFFSENQNSLVEASVMPDYLNYDFGGFLAYYHYTDQPNVYKNEDSKSFFFERFQYDIKWAFKGIINIIKDSLDPEKQKTAKVKKGLMDSLMLRYLLHLAGDSHQPLHSTSLFSKWLNNGGYSKGDHGGNLIKVNDVFAKNITELHGLWDAGIGMFEEMKNLPLSPENLKIIDDKAQGIIQEYPESYFGESSKFIDMDKWITEGHDLAVNSVYADIDIFPILTPQYIQSSRTLCKKRIALAGYRLANLLHTLFDVPKDEEAVTL
jgi:hypothetical protein